MDSKIEDNNEEKDEEFIDSVNTLEEEDSELKKMMTLNFMEYASYVIKDRAIPDIDDGMKPVQRRILHSLNRLDDGKFHKVANVVGHSMQFHPHGDGSIYHALVNIANKEYFIEKQGNFGNIITGDSASAPRYIECRLSPLSKEVLFNKEITQFIDSYDGRNKEPITLPAKIPALLLQGTEGIAVGMATKILPHNFTELLKAQIDLLRNKPICFYPDFLQGGIMDPSQYKHGIGKIILRAKIQILNKKTLIICEIPATTTTESLINSIEDATKAGKIKLAKIQDYTGEKPEIELQLARGVDAETTIAALFAYTQCEVSISSNVVLIKDNQPIEVSVSEVLFHNTQMLVYFLHWELRIELEKLLEKFFEKTLEQIFIEKRLYKAIEKCTTSELVFSEVYKGFNPYLSKLYRKINDEDIEKLLRIPIRRISLYDINKMNENLAGILKEIIVIQDHLQDLKKYAVNYLKSLIKRYGKRYPRRTEITMIKKVNRKIVALDNIKFGYDKKTGYIGTQVKAEHIVCNEFDKFVIINGDGTFKVMNQVDKLYVGRFHTILKADKKQIYSVVYLDKKKSLSYAKRCYINKFILDKEYHICPKGCKLNSIDMNYNIVLTAELEPKAKAKITEAEVNFSKLTLRSASARGFLVAKRKVRKFLKKRRGSERLDDIEVVKENEQKDSQEVEDKNNDLWHSKEKVSFTLPEYILDRLPVIYEDKLADIISQFNLTNNGASQSIKMTEPLNSTSKKKFLIDEESSFTLE